MGVLPVVEMEPVSWELVGWGRSAMGWDKWGPALTASPWAPVRPGEYPLMPLSLSWELGAEWKGLKLF